MKTKFMGNTSQKTTAISLLACACLSAAGADPRIDSWFTRDSGQYARIYTSTADEAAGRAMTTWSRGQGSQSLPVYAGVREISSSANWVYIRSSGLASYVMGPWYLNAAKSQLFPNFPANSKVVYRIPRNPVVTSAKTLTGLGPIGYFVNGVALFDNRDAFYWNGSTEAMGTGLWNRDAFVNESVTFDAALAHQAGLTHHYHANPIALRHQLGDHVDYDAKSNRYSESSAAPTEHSPILAWVRDGFPIYGPYGYANPTNANSGIKRMVSGFVPRNGSQGTPNLAATGRTTIPAWAARANNHATALASSEYGPAVSANYPLGRYVEDNDFLGDLGKVQGIDFDLDEYNGRFCVTPEFPNGTYAYFVTITSGGAPAFPYNLGRSFYGTPSGGAVLNINESVTTNFVGGANSAIRMNAPVVNTNMVTLVWSAVEGGSYQVQSSADLQTWSSAGSASAVLNQAQTTLPAAVPNRVYRVTRNGLAPYDGN